MANPQEVVLDVARSSDAPLLANLLELYLHDLSEAFPLMELGADGRFGYDNLSLYWSDPERRFPFLVRHGTRVVGFVLATRGSPASDDPDVFDVAEFFVIRRHRRSGVGRRAAFLVWDRLPGRWIVRVSEGNTGALPFWASVIAEYTSGTATQFERAGNPNAWRVFSFESPRSVTLTPRAPRDAGTGSPGGQNVLAKRLTPILNVSDIQQSFAWFEMLGWTKAWDWGTPPHFGGVCSGECEIFLCLNGQGGRGRSMLSQTFGPEGDDAADKGVWMSIWVDDVDEVHKRCLEQGLEVTWPPTNMPWNVREMHVRHPDGHVFRISRGIEEE